MSVTLDYNDLLNLMTSCIHQEDQWHLLACLLTMALTMTMTK